MSVSGTKKEPILSSFSGVGTLAGGALGYYGINKHYYKLADKTVQMFDGTLKNSDKFLKRNDELLTKAANSTKGFFGKINKAIGQSDAQDWAQKVEKGAAAVIDEYRQKNKSIVSGIKKSIKDVSKNKTIAVILACAVIGTLLFNGIAKASLKKTELDKKA